MTVFNKLIPAFLLLTASIIAAEAEGTMPTSSAPQQAPTRLDTIPTEDRDTATIPADSIDYDARMMDYDIARRIVLLTGAGVVRYGSMTLYADTIHYLIERSLLLAAGKPMLIDRGDTVVGESMVYNLRTRRGKVQFASARTAGAHYDGRQMVKSDSTVYYIDEGDYTTCAVTEEPHYLFYGKNIKVMPGDKAITRPLVLNIGDAPVAALPYFILPLDRDRKSGFLRWRWGGHPGQGGYLDNVGYYWVPNDYMDFTLAGKIHEFQEYVVNLSGQYRVKYLLSGNISGRYTLSTRLDTLSNRWAIDYNHYQYLLPDQTFTLSGNGSIASGKTFYKTFSEDTTELLHQETNANLSLSKAFPTINASAALTWKRKHNFTSDVISQDFPSFSFSLPTRSLIPPAQAATPSFSAGTPATKWYNDIRYSYRIEGRRALFNSTPEAEQFVDVDHTGLAQNVSLSYSRKVLKYFSLSPTFSAGHSVFDAYIVPDGRSRHDTTAVFTESDSLRPGRLPVSSRRVNNETKYVYFEGLHDSSWVENDTIHRWNSVPPYWNAGVSFSTNIYGLFPIRLFNFAGIRHTISPSIDYRYRPQRTLDREFPSVVSYVGSQSKSQQIGVRIGNLFQGKTIKPPIDGKGEPIENKFTILNAGISASYDFEAEDRKLSDISLSANTSYKIFNLSFSSSFRPYDLDNNYAIPALLSYDISISPRNLSASGTLWDGDILVHKGLHAKDDPHFTGAGAQKWNVSISPSYRFSRSRTDVGAEFTTSRTYNLNMSARLDFSRRWSASWNGYYNFVTGKLEGHSINFHCDLECWDLRFDWRPSGYNPGFYFVVGIKKQPDIKWEYRD